MKAEREKREGPDLIDRRQFAVYSGTVPEGMDAGSYIAGASAVFEAIGNAEAVDAVPVVHGRWIPRKGKWFAYFQCSVCGEKISYPSADGKALTNYCPNCGAKMDG